MCDISRSRAKQVGVLVVESELVFEQSCHKSKCVNARAYPMHCTRGRKSEVGTDRTEKDRGINAPTILAL